MADLRGCSQLEGHFEATVQVQLSSRGAEQMHWLCLSIMSYGCGYGWFWDLKWLAGRERELMVR